MITICINNSSTNYPECDITDYMYIELELGEERKGRERGEKERAEKERAEREREEKERAEREREEREREEREREEREREGAANYLIINTHNFLHYIQYIYITYCIACLTIYVHILLYVLDPLTSACAEDIR